MKLASKLLLRLPLLAATGVTLAFLSLPATVRAEPYNEDEWYDPTDWFDGNNYEYDDTYNPGAYGTSSYYDDAYGAYDYDDYNYRSASDRTRGSTYWRDRYDYDSNIDGSQQSQQGQQRTLAGTIEGFREVNVRDRQGAQDRFTVVRLKMRDGRTATVDLGRRLTLRDVDLQKGDYISVSGRQKTISGQKVILADTIYADGRHHNIARSAGSTDSSRGTAQTTQQSRSGSSSQPLRGTVESFQRVNVEGADASHTLVKLSLDNGTSMIVDLGPDQTTRSLGIDSGDYVSIRGTRTQLNNKPILRAQSVSVNGAWQDIQQTSRQQNR